MKLEFDLPYRQSGLSRHLVCDFFGAVARFEFALKEAGFFRANRFGRAMADWDRFARDVASRLEPAPGSELDATLATLLNRPPQVQVVEGHAIRWVHAPLRGSSKGEHAVDAVQRVRNNLFHGGKHSPALDPARDEALVRSALAALGCFLHLDEEVRFHYENATF